MKALEYLQGKKTYLVMAAALISVLVAFLNGDLSSGQAITMGIEALGLGTLRAAVTRGY